MSLKPPNPRCHAHRSNGSGEQCTRPAMNGQLVCDRHGGRSPQAKAKAFERILAAADPAASELVRLALNKDGKVPDAVKLQAIRDLLDRAGLAARMQVELSGSTGIVIEYLTGENPVPPAAGSAPGPL